MSTAQDRFPFRHSGEPDLPSYLRTRAEGLPLREAILSAVSYLRKYRQAKRTAPPEEIRYFDAQRQLLRQLMALPAPADSTRLAAVGDLMWLRHSWDSFVAPETLAFLNAHEVVLANLETPISARYPVPRLLPDYFTYNSPPALVASFRRPDGRSTFSALSTANNHSLDRGDEGLSDTLDFLDAQGIPHAGVRRRVEEPPFVAWTTNGIRLGFHAACWGFNDPAREQTTQLKIEVVRGLVPRVSHPVDLSGVRSALEAMDRAGVEVKIVSLHWGYEFEFYPDPDIVQVGHRVVEGGADLVLGSHPHVVQPLEICLVNGAEADLRAAGVDGPALTAEEGCLLEDGSGVPRKALIAYCLGNFATAMFTSHCQVGLALGLHLARSPDTGRVDWHHPELTLLHTVQRDRATGGRRLVLLDEYLRQGQGCPAVREMAAFVRGHLLGAAP